MDPEPTLAERPTQSPNSAPAYPPLPAPDAGRSSNSHDVWLCRNDRFEILPFEPSGDRCEQSILPIPRDEVPQCLRLEPAEQIAVHFSVSVEQDPGSAGVSRSSADGLGRGRPGVLRISVRNRNNARVGRMCEGSRHGGSEKSGDEIFSGNTGKP